MCILFFYLNPKPNKDEYKLILVNNRDEYYTRPTVHACIWGTQPKIIAGKDAQPGREGGTWLGISETGKIGCILNILQSKEELTNFHKNHPRGFLSVNFLLDGNSSAKNYIKNIQESKIVYNKFNLLLFEKIQGLYHSIYYNSAENIMEEVELGVVHGFGNSPKSRPLKKVCVGKEKFAKILDSYKSKDKEEKLVEALFEMMSCEERFYPDQVIQELGRGMSEETMQHLSSIFVKFPAENYGTMTTTVILVDANDQIIFREQAMTEPLTDPTKFHFSKFEL